MILRRSGPRPTTGSHALLRSAISFGVEIYDSIFSRYEDMYGSDR
jgi:hypothetical protein